MPMVDPGLERRIRALRDLKKQRSLTADEKAQLDALYAERGRQLEAYCARMQAKPKPLVLDGCERGLVRRIGQVDESYPTFCQRKMGAYADLAECLADCQGVGEPGRNPRGKPCNCIIEPGARFSIDPAGEQRELDARRRPPKQRGWLERLLGGR